VRQREEFARRVVEGGSTIRAAAEAFRVSVRTVSKWVARYREAGAEGMLDRSGRPHERRPATPPAVVGRVKALRLERRTMRAIAAETGLGLTTVRRILLRHGMNRL